MAFRRSRLSLSKSVRRSREKRRDAQRRVTERKLQLERLEHRQLLAVGPQLIGIQPNNGSLLQNGDTRNVAPVDITFRFDENSVIDKTTLGAVKLTRSGGDGVFGNADDVLVTPGFLGLGETSHEVVMRFSETLPDDIYRIDIAGTGSTALRNTAGGALGDTTDDNQDNGRDFRLQFELDLGAKIIAVVPQPVTRNPQTGALQQAREQIVVYFNGDDLDPTTATDPAFYQLIFTKDSVTNTDDTVYRPTTIQYDPANDLARLTFAAPLDQLGSGPGTFRLRIGTDEATPPAPNFQAVAGDPGSSFATARNIGQLDFQSQILSSAIEAQTYDLEFPGASDEPGHRDLRIEIERHLRKGGDTESGISTFFYNFRSDYGLDPEGKQLFNLITETQKQRAREIFELYSTYLGIDFVETASQGITVATGDLRALRSNIPTGQGAPFGAAGRSPGTFNRPTVILDNGELWQDRFGGDWFRAAMGEVGRILIQDSLNLALEDIPAFLPRLVGDVLRVGYSNDLVPFTAMGQENILAFDNPVEPVFPGDADIVHGRHLFRPESKDIDLYRFQIQSTGLFTAEALAERLPDSSLLDTYLTLYRENADGTRQQIARNDDYYSEDSFIRLELTPGTYYIGVSASGNDKYDPTIADTGIGGTSQGQYDLRLNFRPQANRSITDADNASDPNASPTSRATALDGDADGVPGGVYNFWFRAQSPNRTLFVDKSFQGTPNGSLARPYNTIPAAFNAAQPGDVVRIVGNGGEDRNAATLGDNLAYEVGFDALGNPLSDGASLSVPKGVTVMVDSGSIFKLRRARIGVGSSTLAVDRSASSLQVLGTPVQSVFFTSFNDETIGLDKDPFVTTPKPGDWGGLIFKHDLDQAQKRFVYENQGIFLDYVNHADIRYGGGQVVVDAQAQVITPLHMTQARPTVSFNRISRSADAAISADPNSFEETNFHSPKFQLSTPFTSDYDRVGPEIHGNTVLNNSTNGLFVRIQTPAGTQLREMTVSGRWDDTDIVHVVSENLRIQGTPGGPTLEIAKPPITLVTVNAQGGGTLAPGTYNYKLTFVDAAGNEGQPSDASRSVTLTAGQGSVRLANLPPAGGDFVSRRIYRLIPGTGNYQLAATVDASSTSFVDNGTTAGGALVPSIGLLRARLDARLSIDPGTIVKLEGARIETTVGAQFIAEAEDGREVIFTSRLDDRFGGSGTFDTNNDDSLGINESQPSPGDWGGIWLGHAGIGSIDHALITFGGGINKVEGSFAGFNALEIHQARARVANTIFELNADGQGGQAPSHRFGRGFNDDATIFIRGAQPIIVDNIIRNNLAPAINVNANALNHELLFDFGRSTGNFDQFDGFRFNQGPLIRDNRMSNNSINGMKVRGETLSTESVWDDTDIVHVVTDTIYVPDFHTYGGLRLESNPTESLVIKLSGPRAGFTATGRPLDIDDRIGGMLHVVGQPGKPVVFTSLRDDSVGAGARSTDGAPQIDTNNDGDATSPQAGDWRSIRIDQYAHDRNVAVVLEQEAPDIDAPGTNASPNSAQVLGGLAPDEKGGDDNLRLGFDVHGFLNATNDRDVYSFTAEAGTEVWFDIDRSTHALDPVIELLDTNGDVVARSDNSHAEALGAENRFVNPSIPNLDPNDVNKLQKSPYLPRDGWTTNPRDPGMRVVLPGQAGASSTYYVRVRSSNPNLATDLDGGLTSGVYQLQIRLREIDEFPGSTVQFADVRYATDGIEVLGHPTHSPLAGEAAEANINNQTINTAQAIGNLLNSERGNLSIGGRIEQFDDVDFYRFEIRYDSVETIPGLTDVVRHLSTIFDMDYASGFARADTRLSVFDQNFNLVFSADNSNIADDQPAPLNGSDVDDLSRGSAGVFDPYLGTVEMPEGVYYVAVSSDDRMPQEMDQFFNANAANKLLRLEPVDSIRRIAEDRIGFSGGSNIPGSSNLPVLFDGNNQVPFMLGDVVMFVSQNNGLTSGRLSNIRTVDPFTGMQETIVGQVDGGGPSPLLGDIAMRYDGKLFSFNTGFFNVRNEDNTIGNFLQIDTGTADYTNLGDDNIETWRMSTNGGDERVPNGGVGYFFNAMTFIGDSQFGLYAVGDRGAPSAGVERTKNILYTFDQNTGVANSRPSPNFDRTGCPPGGTECRFVGAGTQIRERGQIVTDQASIVASAATDVDANGIATRLITDRDAGGPVRFTISHPSTQTSQGFRTQTTFEFDAGAEVDVDLDQALGKAVRDGYFFNLDEFNAPTGAFYQFDTGTSIFVRDYDNNGLIHDNLADGQTITLFANGAVTLEFEDTTVGDGQETSGSLLIPYDATTTTDQLLDAIAGQINAIPGFNPDATVISSLSMVSVRGDSRINTGNHVLFDKLGSTLSNMVTSTNLRSEQQTVLVPANGGAGVNEGDQFRVGDGNQTVTFEFDSDATTTGGAIPVVYTGLTQDQLADEIVTQIQAQLLRVNVANVGQGFVQLKTGIQLEGERGEAPIVRTINGASIADGSFFIINTFGKESARFEFTKGNPVTAGSIPVRLTALDTPAIVATKIADAINLHTSATARAVNDLFEVNGPQIQFINDTGGGNPVPTSALRKQQIYDREPVGSLDGLIRVEESDSLTAFGDAVESTLFDARPITGTSAQNVSPIRITSANHGLVTGQSVVIEGVTAINGDIDRARANGVWTVTRVDDNTFDLNNSAGSPFNYSGGGFWVHNQASAAGTRINFLAANNHDFSGTPIFTDIGSQGGVGNDNGFGRSNIQVGFLATDTADDIARRIQRIIRRELFPAVTPTQSGDTVIIENGTVVSADPPLEDENVGAGGTVTGIAFSGGTMYAVDDQGGLYRVNNPSSSNATSTFIERVTDPSTGTGVNFAGLTVGPPHAEDGRYRDMLFGITDDGKMYAFDTAGVLQPAFVSGEVMVQLRDQSGNPLTNLSGVAFSNLDYNLWHATTRRGGDAGHGVDRNGPGAHDQSRLPQPGDSSLYFGFESPGLNGVTAAPDPRNRNNYDFPGGAHGSIESNTFSLKGYTAEDQPRLYFNYFLDTEDAQFNPLPNPFNPMRDSIRVFITGDDGQWQLLATNNQFRHQIRADEYEPLEAGDAAVFQADEVNGRRGVQELFDNTGSWRQARIDLGAFAGQDNLRLRFDFSTAGEMNTGDTFTTGDELRAVAGHMLRDGQTFTIDGEVFEFNMGPTLVVPAGAAIPDGERFTVTTGAVTRTFEFNSTGGFTPGAIPIPVSDNLTAIQMAQRVQNAIAASGLLTTPQRNDNRINLTNLPTVSQAAAGGFSLKMDVEGSSGLTNNAHRAVIVHSRMSATEVRDAIVPVLAATFSGNVTEAFKTYREAIRIIGHDVTEQGPLGLTSFMFGDHRFTEGLPFGAFNASGPPEIPGRYPGALRGMDNNHEGVYIDDIIIGFAERGEMVTNSIRTPGMIKNPQVPDNSILEGSYQLEIRQAEQYGVTLNQVIPDLFLRDSFDTNDRFVQQFSLIAPSADQILDGQTFTIDDGVDSVTFEYEDVKIGDGVAPGHFRIPFNTNVFDPQSNSYIAESSAIIAARIRDSINSTDVQAVLDIVAGIDNGRASGSSIGSNRVNLYGNADVNLSSATIQGIQFDNVGDKNIFRDQGQILIQGNVVRDSLNFGIVSDAGARNRSDLAARAGTLPHAGPARNLSELNDERLVPGVVIENNLVVRNGRGGIHFSGDPNSGNSQLAPMPFGRILNNTLYGNADGDVGIRVDDNASPTLLNNIIANFTTGIRVAPNSSTTVIGGSLYQNNVVNTVGAGLGDFPIVLGPAAPLFVDAANGNFYPAAGSSAIDSSIDSLEDRPALATVRDPLGISRSPILAPNRDITGQLRVDDPAVATPAGQGANVFKDRGAIDRADFTGPTALLILPRDNDADGKDLNRSNTVVRLAADTVLSKFSIQLVDGIAPAEPSDGIGVDNRTVTTETVVLRRNGVVLQDGVDYSFSYNGNNNTIQLTPLAGIWPPNAVYTIELNNTDEFTLAAPNGQAISDGNVFTITDADGVTRNFEFDSGYRVQVPQTLRLQVPTGGGGTIADGETFAVGNGTNTVIFEFDSDNSLKNSQNTRIAFASSDTADQIADKLVAALTGANLGLKPVKLSGGQVHMGSRSNHTVNVVQTQLTASGRAGGIADTQTFTVDDGSKFVTFEFVDTDVDNQVSAGNIAIPFTRDLTHAQIAGRIVTAVRDADLGLIPTDLGGGDVFLGGDESHTLNVTLSALQLTGSPGVSPPFGIHVPSRAGQPFGLTDGETFTITDGVTTVRFELDNNGSVGASNIAVPFDLNGSIDVTADNLVAAINSASVALNAVNAGHGRVHLNDSRVQHQMDVSQTGLSQLGSPGVRGNVRVGFAPIPQFDAKQVAASVVQAINGAGLAGVTALPGGGNRIVIEGAQNVTDSRPIFTSKKFVAAIGDLAGNDLKPNQLSGETQFTIMLGTSQLDLGDAPDPNYPVLLGSNGAVHMVKNGVHLGAANDAELDGQPSANADGDGAEDDGVAVGTLNQFVMTPIDVTASTDGLLDAWIDFNQDGDWEDAGEQIFASKQISAGLNVLSTDTPASAKIGTTYARFRFSTMGGLRPTGLAANGEVEDYKVTVADGTPPNASHDSYSIGESGTLTGNVITDNTGNGVDSDPENDPITVARVNGSDTNVGSALALPSGATLTLNADGSFSYDASTSSRFNALADGATDTDTFTYRISDGLLLSKAATVTITVTGENDNPVATGDSYATNEDTPLTGQNVISDDTGNGSDADPDTGDSITVSEVNGSSASVGAAVLLPSGATLTMNSDGSFSYDPSTSTQMQSLADGAVGNDSFTYTLSDGKGGMSTATVSLTINGLNDAPVARNNQYGTAEDTTRSGNVLADDTGSGVDSDPDAGDSITVSAVNGAGASVGTAITLSSGATLTVNANGSYTYDPTTSAVMNALSVGQSKDDSFTYTIRDNAGETSTATVTITVDGRNDLPTARDNNYATDEDTQITRNLITDNDATAGQDSDPDTNDVLTVARVNGEAAKVGSSFALTSGATLRVDANGTMVYDPSTSTTFNALSPGQSANDSFTYTISDGNGGTSTATVQITVNGLNEPPTANDDLYTVAEGDQLVTSDALGTNTPSNTNDDGVLANDTDADSAKADLQVELLNGPAHHTGTFVLNADGTFTYQHDGSETTTDSFTYRAKDQTSGVSNVATVTINVTPVNDPPAAVADSYTVDHGRVLMVNDASGTTTPSEPNDNSVLLNDTDADSPRSSFRAQLVQPPQHNVGTFVLNQDGTFIYEHDGSQTSSDTFTYRVSDGTSTGNTVTVTINVTPPPPPAWQNQSNRLDVNNDGFISPIDALLIINDLNFNGPRKLPAPSGSEAPPPFLDSSGDGSVSAVDALLVINFLNNGANPEPAAEGEPMQQLATAGDGGSTSLASGTGASSILVGSLLAPANGELGGELRGLSNGRTSSPESPAKPFASRTAEVIPAPVVDEDQESWLEDVARHSSLKSLELEDVLADIAGDLAANHEGETLEDLALTEVLGVRTRRS